MRLLLAVLVVAIGGSLSCSNRITVPVVLPDEDIRFELVASGGGSAGDPVTFRGLIRNAGGAAVMPYIDCGEHPVRIYDATRTELYQVDPTQPVPCPLADVAPLLPGQTIEFSLTFDGDYFSETGDPLTAPAGYYRAIATFRYQPPNPEGPSDLHGLTRELSFNWQ
jgi:hypothetical protein